MIELGSAFILALFAVGFSITFVVVIWGYSFLLDRAGESVLSRQPKEVDEMYRFIQSRVDIVVKSLMLAAITIIPFAYDYLPVARSQVSVCIYLLPLAILAIERCLKWYYLKKMLADQSAD